MGRGDGRRGGGEMGGLGGGYCEAREMVKRDMVQTCTQVSQARKLNHMVAAPMAATATALLLTMQEKL